MNASAWILLLSAFAIFVVGQLFYLGLRNNKTAKSFSYICFLSSFLIGILFAVYTAPSKEAAFQIHYLNAVWGLAGVLFIYLFISIKPESKFLSSGQYLKLGMFISGLVIALELIFKNSIHKIVSLELLGYSVEILPHWINLVMLLLTIIAIVLPIIEFVLLLKDDSTNQHQKQLVRSLMLFSGLVILLGIPIFLGHSYLGIPLILTQPLFYLLTVGLIGWAIYMNGLMEPNSVSATQKILENTTNFILLVDNDLKIKEVNARLGELSDISEQNYINKSVTILFPGITKVLKFVDEHKYYTTEFPLISKTEPIPVELFLSAVMKNNKQIGYLVVGNDMSHHIETQQQLTVYAQKLESHAKKLERSNQELEDFAAIVSHDLRAPMRTISGFANILDRRNRDQLSEDSKEYLDFIVNGCQNMTNMIDGLLDYAKYGPEKCKFEYLNLENVLQDVVRGLGEKIASNQAEITFGNLHNISGDKIQMRQLFQNLIENAIKYKKKNEIPKIHIQSEALTNGTMVSIKDNGIGIKKNRQKHIFKIFNQINSESEGLGLGLATCLKIIHNHKGNINVFSDEGQGTTFRLFLPKMAS